MGTITNNTPYRESLVSERYYVTPSKPEFFEIYVNSDSGTDTKSGTGPQGNNANKAFKTLARALEEVAFVTNDDYFQIILAGDATHIMPDEFHIPATQQTKRLVAGAGLYGLTAPLHIRADPKPLLLVTAASQISVTPDAVTGQYKMVTTGGMTPNAFKGKIFTQFGIPLGVVSSNSATEIFTTVSDSSFTTIPMTLGVDALITGPGATIQNSTGAPLPAITISNNLTTVLWESCEFKALSAAAENSVYHVYQRASIYYVACEFEGVFLGYVNPGGFAAVACYFKAASYVGSLSVFNWIQPQSVIDGCFAEGVTMGNDVSGVEREGLNFNACAFKSCGPLLQLDPDGTYVLSPTRIVSFGEFSGCDIQSSTGVAIQLRGSGVLRISNTKIEGSVGDAIVCLGPILLDMKNVPAGAGNLGLGINLSEGAHLEADNAVALSGAAGDVKLGHLAASTWAAIAAAPNRRLSDSGANGDFSTAISRA